MGAVEHYQGKRASYYVYRIDLPPDITGKRRQQRVTRDRRTGERWTSKKACQMAMRAHEVELRTGIPIEATQQTVGQYMEQWLDDIAGRVTPSTLRNYRDNWKRLAPYLESIQVQHLQTLAIQQAMRTLEQRYAPDTIRLTHTVLHAALRQAVRWSLIPRNPADGVVLPASRPVRSKSVWTVEETQRFLASTQGEDLHALWRLLLDTGMRIGEALALGWQHISLDGSPARVRIERTIAKSRDGYYIGSTTKTRRSRRTLAIQPETAAALQALKADQERRQARYGSFWNDSGLVFDRGGGDMMLPRHAASQLEHACRQAGVPRHTPHEIRHTFTTLAVQRGVPLKLIADRLGHANTNLIADIYAHVTEEGDWQVSEALRSVLNPPNSASEPLSCRHDDLEARNAHHDAKTPANRDY